MQPSIGPPTYSAVPIQSTCCCLHRRIVDDVRNADGKKTGRLLCLECFTEFPDPDYQVSRQ